MAARNAKKSLATARHLARDGARICRRLQRRGEAPKDLYDLVAALRTELEGGDSRRIEAAAAALDGLLDARFRSLRRSEFREWLESLLFAVGVALLLRTFVVEAFKIPSGSMIPTLLIGDHIFVNKLAYGIRLPFSTTRLASWAEPQRGDLIVFIYPDDPSKDYIKRVIGLPGDNVRVEGERLWINGQPIEQKAIGDYAYRDERTSAEVECTRYEQRLGEAVFTPVYLRQAYHPSGEYAVEPGHVFVMGDNRDNSSDSRVWGQVPLPYVKGRAVVIWFSWSDRPFEAARPWQKVRWDRLFTLVR